MEPRYAARMKEMLAQAEVSSDLIDGLTGRLETFVLPFSVALSEPEQRQHTLDYISGLLSKLDHKTAEAIVYLHDEERQGLQKFMGHVPWDHQPLLMRGRLTKRNLKHANEVTCQVELIKVTLSGVKQSEIDPNLTLLGRLSDVKLGYTQTRRYPRPLVSRLLTA